MDEGTPSSERHDSRNYFTPRNIIMYLLVAILLYGAIYFLFLNKKGSDQTNNAMAPQASPTQTVATSPTETMTEPMTVTLDAQNDSGETGTAVLTEEEEGKTKVTLTIAGAPKGIAQPAHIHSGACPKPGAIVYPLTNVVNGVSETTLDVDTETLMKQLPLAINVHKSASQAAIYVACGDLK